ncbi:MAG: ferrous iron transport protein B [Planctomycetaceae bacterium]|nr:ferrous iron transport protein B [Planctomycetaceae bacterium]
MVSDNRAGIERPAIRIALIGNPNTGKSTLFNALARMNVRTGNYPGVTVEKRIGRAVWSDCQIELIDLPGTYSLSPRSPDEMVAVDVLTGHDRECPPDVVVCICNAASLERNLFLVSQVRDVGLPMILCLNMWDSALQKGITINLEQLSQEFGVPVVATSAHKRSGLQELQQAILTEISRSRSVPHRSSFLPSAIQAETEHLLHRLSKTDCPAELCTTFLVSRALLDPGSSVEQLLVRNGGDSFVSELQAGRDRLAVQDLAVPGVEARERYKHINDMLGRVTSRGTATSALTLTDRIDAVLTHRLWGLLICACLMILLFSALNWFTAPLSDGVETILGGLSDLLVTQMDPGPFRSLLTDGIIAGVGAILVFLPQICLLFLFIALLEDCGYMARAAFMMDRLMAVVGLSGRSFLPLMSSFACAVPGIMATRVIEDRRDRFVTILIAPLMSCSARLPVYVLMTTAFIPDVYLAGGWLSLRAVVLLAMSSLGALIAIPIAWGLRRTVFRGGASPFLLELPDYRVPSIRVVFSRVWESGQSFVAQAGTLIFATTVVIWAVGSFPSAHPDRFAVQKEIEQLERDDDEAHAEQIDLLSARLNQMNADVLENSYLGRAGHLIEPVVRPLGWDWKIGVGVIASFPAREVIIATMGTIYSLGGDVDESDDGLRGALQRVRHADGRIVFSIPVALSVMVFFALCAQCVSTLLVIRRETNSWLWPVVTFVYMTALAWIGAFATYQIGRLI